MRSLKPFVKRMILITIFLLQELLNKLDLWRGKNRSLEELTITMLNENHLPKYFWVDVISTTCYVLNRVIIRPLLKLTPYEIHKGRKPNISHPNVFGCKCFVLNNDKE